jgi:hypothetical protein
MPSTTTRFGWPYPLSSDLVRDGAENIQDLAEAVETTMGVMILRTLQTVKADTFSTTSVTYVDVTGLTQAITPAKDTNKVLVCCQVAYSYNDAGGGAGNTGYLTLARGATNLAVPTSPGSRIPAMVAKSGNTNDGDLFVFSGMYLDSPATTSATTYAVQASVEAGTIYVNRSEQDTDADNRPRGISVITLFEVAA